MSGNRLPHGLHFFGNLVGFDCHIQDLKLVLRKTEEIEFPDHVGAPEGGSLISSIFPDITRKSFIVTLVIALDEQFKSHCEIVKEATGQNLKWTDLKGSALERFVTYAEKLCGLRSLYDDLVRQKLVGLIELRNCIVHNNSSLEGFRKRAIIEGFSKQIEGVEINAGYIRLELIACTNCADIVLEFMQRAYYSALEKSPKE